MKKYLSRLLIFILCIAGTSINLAMAETGKSDLEIKGVVLPTAKINKGDLFQFGFIMKNNTSEKLRDVKVEIKSDSFYSINEGKERTYDLIGADEEQAVTPFTLKYNGSDQTRLFLEISYKIAKSENVIEKTFYFPTTAVPGDRKDGSEANTELYRPELILVNGTQPKIDGLEEGKVVFNVKNDSRYNASNVKFEANFKDSNFELTEISAVKRISKIDAKSVNEVQYMVRGKSGVKSGVYPITINYSFENEYKKSWSDSYTVYIRYEANNLDTNVELNTLGDYEAVVAGEDFKLDLEVKNVSDSTIKDVSVELFDLNSNNMINRNSNYQKIEGVQGQGTAKVSFDMSTNESAETGNYKIKVKISYKDAQDKKKEFEKYFYKKIEKHESEIYIGGIVSSKQIVKKEDEILITVPVYNYGKKDAQNLKISVQGESGLIYDSSNLVLVDRIKAGEKKEVSFKFKVSPKITEGNKSITVKVNDGKREKTSSIVVYAESEEKEVNSSVPKIIISKYQPEPVMVKAGKNFDLKLAFLNTHREKTVRNIKITLTTNEGSDKTGSVFSPVNSSNTFYIDEISPKQEAEMNITMFTIPDAKSKTYTINVHMEYEDEKGKQYSASDIIGVPVRQQSKFITSDINVPEQSEIGRAIRLDIDINNNGKIELANFTVKVEGDFSTQDTTKYIGSIQPGAREYYDVDLMPTKEGVNKGVFIFTYEEPTGEVVEQRKEFSSTASKPYIPEYNSNEGNIGNIDMPMPPVKKGFPWVKVVLGVGAIGVIVMVIVISKNKKKKKEMELDE